MSKPVSNKQKKKNTSKEGFHGSWNKPRSATRKPRRPRRPTTSTLDPYTKMVLDPCGSTLVPGVYGSIEGLLGRTKRNFAPNLPTHTCGYVLWCPDYTGYGMDSQEGYQSNNGSLFTWTSTVSTNTPINNENIPYGSNAPGDPQPDTATARFDPASPLLNTNLVSDLRVVNACIQLTYYGALLESAGEVGFISNLPAEELLGIDGYSMSVDELMNYTNHKTRFGAETLEITYKLAENSSEIFRSTADNLYTQIGFGTNQQKPLQPNPVNRSVPRVFGFVWRNVLPGAGLSIDVTKSVEWRPEVISGLVQVPIHTVGPNLVNHINIVTDTLSDAAGHNVTEHVGAETIADIIAKGIGDAGRAATARTPPGGWGTRDKSGSNTLVNRAIERMKRMAYDAMMGRVIQWGTETLGESFDMLTPLLR